MIFGQRYWKAIHLQINIINIPLAMNINNKNDWLYFSFIAKTHVKWIQAFRQHNISFIDADGKQFIHMECSYVQWFLIKQFIAHNNEFRKKIKIEINVTIKEWFYPNYCYFLPLFFRWKKISSHFMNWFHQIEVYFKCASISIKKK